jgi:hypothetical protein
MAMIEAATVTVVIAAVAIEGLGISVTHIAPRPRAIEVSSCMSGAAIGAHLLAAVAAGEIATAAAGQRRDSDLRRLW